MSVIVCPVNIDKKNRLAIWRCFLTSCYYCCGIGSFGRHNLVIHPEIGTKVLFKGIITDLEIQPATP